MTLVYPRPDSETRSWARHRKAYPGLEYRIPVAIQGGAYPFFYEIVKAPDGMSIGEHYGMVDYGVLSWMPDPSLNGEQFDVEVRVTDQELTTQTASFRVRISDSTDDFIFVDGSVARSGDGSIGAPLKRFADLHGDAYPGNGALANAGISTHAGKAVYFRAGRYMTADVPTPWLPWGSDRRPYAFLGFPGEDAEIVFTNAKLGNNSNGSLGADFFVGGIKLRRSQDMTLLPVTNAGGTGSTLFGDGWSTGNSSRMFWLTGSPARTTLFELFVSEQGPWIHPEVNHGGNSGMLYASAMGATSFRDYFTAWDIQAQDMRETIIGSIYSTRYGVVEGVRVVPDSGEVPGTIDNPALVFVKQNGINWSLRRNEWTGFRRSHNQNGALYVSSGPRSGNNTIPPTVELCFNVLHSVGNDKGYIINYSQSGTSGDGYPEGVNVWIYRNTLIGGFYRQTKPMTVTFENNVAMLRNASYADAHTPQTHGSALTTIIGDVDLLGDYRSWQDYLDTDYRLKGKYREELLGVVGHEIASPGR